MIYYASCLLLPPISQSDNLSLLILNPETAPIFKLTAQLTYSHENINKWTAQLSTNSPAKTEDNLNLLIDLDDSVDFAMIASDLERLSFYFPHFSISILPNKEMTDETYILEVQKLFDELHTNSSLDFSLTVYPLTANKLSLYEKDYITMVGTVLINDKGLEDFEKIYTHFINKKTLVVRDDIRRFYGNETSIAASEINKLYYLLAIKYPGVDTIFSPYIIPPYDLTDDYTLDRSDSDYYLFYTIYNRLLDKTWITIDLNYSVTTDSPFIPLNSYSELTGECELIVAPDADIIKKVDAYRAERGSSPYLSFKWNNEYLPITSYYPYSMLLDTASLSNGISRLTATLQDENLDLLSVYSIDLIINHPLASKRAHRIKTAVTTDTISNMDKRKNNYIPILMYHTVTDSVAPEEQNSCVETKVFESQMKGLLDAGYTPINFYDLKEYVNGLAILPDKPVMITMDDGYLNNYTHAYPIYKKYGIQATLFISPYYVQEENTDRHFGWKAAREMEASGLIDIQAHGYDHTPLPYLSLKDVKYHITLAQGLIEMNLGPRDVSVVAYPQFRNTKYTRKVLSDLNVEFQITKLAKKGTLLIPNSLKRINVPNTMSSDELIATLDSLTA